MIGVLIWASEPLGRHPNNTKIIFRGFHTVTFLQIPFHLTMENTNSKKITWFSPFLSGTFPIVPLRLYNKKTFADNRANAVDCYFRSWYAQHGTPTVNYEAITIRASVQCQRLQLRARWCIRSPDRTTYGPIQNGRIFSELAIRNETFQEPVPIGLVFLVKPETYARPEFSHNCAQGPKMLVQCVLRAVVNLGNVTRSSMIAAPPSTSPLGDSGSEPKITASG